ncbi:DUF6417 family protein [Streptomyces sp. NPDC049915]|uniref:DUF6417 family protein n=1 Tax=Streptomyces sp. NPDC049915 TaxID=3155510 RepID=UPI003437F7C4
MNARQSRLDALRALREREAKSVYGWVLSTDVPPGLQQSLQTAAAQGLVELADREVRAELSAYEGRPVLWAARLSPQGHDVLTYLHASPDPTPLSTPPAAEEQVIELRPAQMDALRVYTNLAPVLRVAPADGLVERVRTAHFDRPGNRWRMTLTPEQIESIAYAFHLRALSGSVAEANWFAREYGVAYRMDQATGRPEAVRSRSRTVCP